MPKLKKTLLLLISLAFIVHTPAWSGSVDKTSKPALPAKDIAALAKKVQKTLALKGARVAIIARMGRDKKDLPASIHYTHTAIAVFSEITTKDKRKVPGYVIYNLYQSPTNKSESFLAQDYPLDFFSLATEAKAGVIIPSEELQKRLLKLIASGDYKKLHNPNYSLISNPFDLQFQNCTEFTLNVITSAIYQTLEIEQIKANLQAYYIPHTIRLDPLTLMATSVINNELRWMDHDRTGIINLVSYASIVSFLTAYNAAEEVIEVKL